MKLFPMTVALALALVAGCATAPKPLTMSETREISAVVTQIDLATRQLTIKGDAGNEFTVQVDPAVRNLPQVKVGDRVVARYYESIAADLRRPGDATTPTVELSDSVAEAGKRPAGMVGQRTTLPVTIVSIDQATHVVTFFGPDKLVRKFEVRTPQGREYIKRLKGGEQIILTFTEALAISVEPAK